jgi:predicted nucleic acid-binding protein
MRAATVREFRDHATKLLRRGDPKDVDVLALTLSLKYPLWSNDRNFEGTGIERFTTAQLLKLLFEQEAER